MRCIVSQMAVWGLVVSQLFLSNLVLSTPTPSLGAALGNQWTQDANDPLKYCQNQCNDVCVACSKPHKCDVTPTIDANNVTQPAKETYCGLAPAIPVMGVKVCPQHEICVPTGFHCPYPEELLCSNPPCEKCNLVQIVTCDPDSQEKCDGGKDEITGCRIQDTCKTILKNNAGNNCPVVCPKKCEEDEMLCQKPTTPGCEKETECVEKTSIGAMNKNGNNCPIQQCTPLCEDDEILCPGKINEETGCKEEEDQCIKKGLDKDENQCAGTCPIECKEPEEIKCESQTQLDGCKTPESCRTKFKNTNGEFCPDSSDSHGCPIICKENEYLCEAREDPLGCKEQAICKPITKDNTNENDCPQTSVCPTPCKPHQISCPGGMEENGCKKPDVCVDQTHDFEGNLCPANCPAICDEKQIKCEGHREYNNCKSPETCHEIGTKTKGNAVGELCPGYCPADCRHDEVLCPSQVDCDGCLTQEVCRPKATNKFGQACPLDSHSHDCPIVCDAEAGEILCDVHEDEFGCKPKTQCMVPQKANDGEWCPKDSVCPAAPCKGATMECPGGFDDFGCKRKHTCEPAYIRVAEHLRDSMIADYGDYYEMFYYNDESHENFLWNNDWGKDLDRVKEICPNHCEPVCTFDEYVCPGMRDERGCPLQKTCHKKRTDFNDEQCPEICPVQCAKNQIKHDAELSDLGCWMEERCVDCSSIEVGELKSSENGTTAVSKTLTVPEGLKCPNFVNKDNWLNDQRYSYTFELSQEGNQLTVTRSDVSADWAYGWTMDLYVSCCPAEEVLKKQEDLTFKVEKGDGADAVVLADEQISTPSDITTVDAAVDAAADAAEEVVEVVDDVRK